MRKFTCNAAWWAAMGMALAVFVGWLDVPPRIVAAMAFMAIAGVNRHDLYRL